MGKILDYAVLAVLVVGLIILCFFRNAILTFTFLYLDLQLQQCLQLR